MGYSLLRHREIPCNTCILTIALSKGNEVDIPQAGCGSSWQHKQARKRRYVQLEEFSFLLNKKAKSMKMNQSEIWILLALEEIQHMFELLVLM